MGALERRGDTKQGGQRERKGRSSLINWSRHMRDGSNSHEKKGFMKNLYHQTPWSLYANELKIRAVFIVIFSVEQGIIDKE